MSSRSPSATRSGADAHGVRGASVPVGLSIALGVAAFALRLVGIDYNGPFTDESYYAYAAQDGNVDNIIGEAYLWPALAGVTHGLGGVVLSRVVTALFGAATCVFVFWAAHAFGRRVAFAGDAARSGTLAGAAAAVLCATAGSTFYISRFATYDAPAVMGLAAGFCALVHGVESGSRRTLVVAAVLSVLAAMTRYMVILYVPVVLAYAIGRAIVVHRLRRVAAWFVVPLLACAGGYAAVALGHIRAAIAHAERADAGTVGGSLAQLAKNAWLLVGSAFLALLAIGLVAVLVRAVRRRTVPIALDGVFLACAAALVVVHHAHRESGFSFHKNLATGIVFGAMLAGLGFAAIAVRAARRGPAGVGAAALALLAIGVTTFVGQRNVTAGHERNWPDYRPVIAMARAANVGPAPRVFATRGDLAVALRPALGRGVDQNFPWFLPTPMHVLRTAGSQNVDLVVGPVFSRRFELGDVVHGYAVTGVCETPRMALRCYRFERATRRVVVPRGVVDGETPFGGTASGRVAVALPAALVSGAPVRVTQLGVRVTGTEAWAADRFRIRLVHEDDRDAPITVFDGPLRVAGGPAGRWVPLCFRVAFGHDGERPLRIEIEFERTAVGDALPIESREGEPWLALRLDHAFVLRPARSSAARGARVALRLSTGRPGLGYRIGAALSDTPREIAGVTIGLGDDPLARAAATPTPPTYERFVGFANRDGRADAAFTVPDVPSLRGATIYFAALLFDGDRAIAATNTCALRVE